MPSYSISNVNVGTYPNDSQGEPLRTAFIKINQNLANVYAYANLAYYSGLGGGNGGANTTITNVTNFYGSFEGWPNVTAANLSILLLATFLKTFFKRLINDDLEFNLLINDKNVFLKKIGTNFKYFSRSKT